MDDGVAALGRDLHDHVAVRAGRQRVELRSQPRPVGLCAPASAIACAEALEPSIRVATRAGAVEEGATLGPGCFGCARPEPPQPATASAARYVEHDGG